MSNKIEAVSDTVDKNVNMLKDVISNVGDIHKSMNGIRIAGKEINQAMEASSSDAERLSFTTQAIHKDATESVGFAKQISAIDDELSSIVTVMFEGVKGGKHGVTNEEFLEVILKTMKSHKIWIEGLHRIVTEMRVYPLQTNSNKCAFGHFYNAIHVDHNSIFEEWKQIDAIHHSFHNAGDKVINAVKQNNESEAKMLYSEASNLSTQMLALLEKVESKVAGMIKDGVSLF